MFSVSPTGAWAAVANGDVNGDGVVNAADVVLAQRIAMGIVTATPDQLSRGDVAPIGAPDGVINAADVVVIQRIAMGLIKTYSITASADANGTISSSGTVSVISGATATFTVTPNTGYHVSDVVVDGISKGAITSYSFTNVTANHTIAASFAVNAFTITASADANGTISPSGAVSVISGATTTFTVTPNTGYRVSDVLVDGVSQGAITSYTFTNVTANHTITASFAVSDTTPPTGSIVINNGAAFTNTTTVTLTLSATDSGSGVSQMQFSNDGLTWSIAEPYATSKSWALTTGDGTKTVYAKFKDNAGNWMTIPCNSSITLDTTPPTVAITSPTAGNTNNTTPILTYTVSNGTVVVRVDSSVVNKVSGNNLDILSFGTHTVRVESTDAANNIGYAEVTFTVVDPSLVGLWHMDGDWTDATGNGLNGTAYNGATFSTSAEVGSQAGSFDGVNDYVTAVSGIISNVSNTFTIVFWANPAASRNVTSESNSGATGISGQRYAVAPQYGGNTDSGAGVSVGNNGISVFEHGANYLPSLLVYNTTLSGWNHVAVVYQNKQPKLYVNGQFVRTGLTSQRANVHPSTLFGNVPGTTYGPYQGLLDEVAIYSRALSEQEIGYAAGVLYVQIISPAGLINKNTPLLNYTIGNGGTVTAVKVDGNVVSKVSGDTLDIVSDGTHTLRIEAVSNAGIVGFAETTFTVDTLPPTVSINPVTSPTNTTTQTITGSMENGAAVTVSVDTSATPGVVTYPTASTWSCTLTYIVSGSNNITVTATDAANNSASTTATILQNLIAITNVMVNNNVLDVSSPNNATIFFNLYTSTSATVTLKIIPEKQGSAGTPVYQASQICTATGAYSFTWDGKNSSGQVVPDDAYLFILNATDSTGTKIYSPGQPAGTGSMSCSRNTYDPYINEPLTVSYSLAPAGRVMITVNQGNQIFTIMDSVPHVAGTYTFDWDGRSPSGTVLNGVAVSCGETVLLRENHIITTGDTPKITSVKTDPYHIDISFGQFSRITYSLSQQATVTVKLISPSGATAILLNSQLQTAGPQTLEWRGMNAADPTGKGIVISEEGDYMVWIQAVNPVTGSSSIARGSLRIGL